MSGGGFVEPGLQLAASCAGNWGEITTMATSIEPNVCLFAFVCLFVCLFLVVCLFSFLW